jgi:protein-L-isoaspartate(D-aspartate) O-methyltransferase
MVQHDIVDRGVGDPNVAAAMRAVPREEFVLPGDRRRAYADRSLPIGHDQTISQPYVVAIMLAALDLQPDDRLLEIGSGSGYAVAVASLVCREVIGVERVRALADESAERLARLGYEHVSITSADGTTGWPDQAPYDAILVSAAGPDVPAALLDQLADGGRLVIPVGRSQWSQRLVRIVRSGDRFDETDLGGVAFVPLIGAEGWRT